MVVVKDLSSFLDVDIVLLAILLLFLGSSNATIFSLEEVPHVV